MIYSVMTFGGVKPEMQPWCEFIISIMVFGVTGIVLLYCIIQLFRKKKSKKMYAISALTSFLVIVCFGIFLESHQTTFKYNDWEMLNSNINDIQNKYGEFDIGEIQEGKSGRVGYYIYTDDGPIMPDYLKHYYYIRYDENGIVYEVYDSCQPGG